MKLLVTTEGHPSGQPRPRLTPDGLCLLWGIERDRIVARMETHTAMPKEWIEAGRARQAIADAETRRPSDLAAALDYWAYRDRNARCLVLNNATMILVSRRDDTLFFAEWAAERWGFKRPLGQWDALQLAEYQQLENRITELYNDWLAAGLRLLERHANGQDDTR